MKVGTTGIILRLLAQIERIQNENVLWWTLTLLEELHERSSRFLPLGE